MIGFFPKPYPNELLYSLLSRYHQRSGNARFVFTAEELYRNGKITHPSIDFVNAFTDDAMMWLTKEKPWNVVAEEHTMFPAFIRFLPLSRRKEAEEGLRSQNGNWKNLMCLPVLEERRYLRFCPLCAKEDREKYCETYWHREHQIPRIRVCPRHRLFLENSTIPIYSKTTPGLFDAESNVPENTVPRVYDGMPIMTQTYMQKIFNGHNFDNFFVLQLAFFEGISVAEITNIPSNVQSEQYEELYRKLAEKHDIDYVTISEIGNEIIQHMQTKVSKISGPKRKEYDKLDEELLPKVKKIVDEMIGKDGKPERVYVTKIQRLMGLPQKQFNKLPKCRKHIESKAETQEEYWKRKVEWAVKEIENEGEIVTVSKVMKLTNMRKGEIERCYIHNTFTILK